MATRQEVEQAALEQWLSTQRPAVRTAYERGMISLSDMPPVPALNLYDGLVREAVANGEPVPEWPFSGKNAADTAALNPTQVRRAVSAAPTRQPTAQEVQAERSRQQESFEQAYGQGRENPFTPTTPIPETMPAPISSRPQPQEMPQQSATRGDVPSQRATTQQLPQITSALRPLTPSGANEVRTTTALPTNQAPVSAQSGIAENATARTFTTADADRFDLNRDGNITRDERNQYIAARDALRAEGAPSTVMDILARAGSAGIQAPTATAPITQTPVPSPAPVGGGAVSTGFAPQTGLIGAEDALTGGLAGSLGAIALGTETARDDITGGLRGARRDLIEGSGRSLGFLGAGRTAARDALNRGAETQLQAINRGADRSAAAIRNAQTGAIDRLSASNQGARRTLSDVQSQALGQLRDAFSGARSDVQQQGAAALGDISGAAQAGQQYLTDAAGNVQSAFTGEADRFAGFADQGNQAAQRQAALSGALGAQAQQAAFDSFVESPSQRFLRERQEQALLRNAAATGGLRGGRVQTALQEQAAGFAAQDLDNEIARLNQIAQRGFGAAGQQANIGTQGAGLLANIAGQQLGLAERAGTQQAGIRQNLVSALANLGSQSGTAQAGLTSELGQQRANLTNQLGQQIAGARTRSGENLANIYGQQGTQASNVRGQQFNNIANLLQQTAQQQANIQQDRTNRLFDANIGASNLLADIAAGAADRTASLGTQAARDIASNRFATGQQQAANIGSTTQALANLLAQQGSGTANILGAGSQNLGRLLGNVNTATGAQIAGLQGLPQLQSGQGILGGVGQLGSALTGLGTGVGAIGGLF